MPRNHRIANIPAHKCETCGAYFRRYINIARPRPLYCGRACVRWGPERKNAQPLLQRFWSKVRKSEGCWIWLGGIASDYGTIGVKNRNLGAHVCSWEIHNGPVPHGMRVLHRCDNPPCVRPDHLFLGTQKDNMQDMISKGRADGNRVLAEPQVREIRRLYALGGISYDALGRQFGVGPSAINHIVHRRTWRNVD